MTAITNISIPKPCHESWAQMTPVENGRHCQSCCKTVIDFSTMTDAEVIGYLSKQPQVCGRFGDLQLIRINQQLQHQQPSFTLFKRIGMVAAVLMAIPFAKANAQKKHKTEQAPLRQTHRDTLTITSKQLTPADIKINVDSTMVKDHDLKFIDSTQNVSTVLGGFTAGVTIRPTIARVWTSVYDMLREY